jgi:hypothetical protein
LFGKFPSAKLQISESLQAAQQSPSGSCSLCSCSGHQDVFSAFVLFLSSRYTVALRSEDFPGFDGAAYCAPLLFDRARS